MNGDCHVFGSCAALILLILNSCSTETPSSSSSNSIDSPPAIREIRKTKSSMKVGDIVTLSVDVDNPQGQEVTYFWYNSTSTPDGENFVNGNFLGSNESRQVSWQANEIWVNNAPGKNYGVAKIVVDVGNFITSTSAYALITVYP